jgi:hypothetical protein
MKKIIIKINDVSQINTSRISVYDLNNRYIDPLGNIYGLKYNKNEKKVEIIKLERFHSSESHLYQKKFTRHKEMKPDTGAVDEQENDNDSQAQNNGISGEEAFFDPQMFIEELINNATVHKERLTGIIKNIYDSDVFSKENKQDASAFDDIVRNLEIDGIQQLEKLDTYYRELTNYPRSITYYQAKIDNTGKQVFEKLAGNKQNTMRFIFLYEMSTTIKRIYTNLKKHILHLDEFTSGKNIDERQNLSKHHKQSFLDATISIKNTIQDIDAIMEKNAMLYDYACDIQNYK